MPVLIMSLSTGNIQVRLSPLSCGMSSVIMNKKKKKWQQFTQKTCCKNLLSGTKHMKLHVEAHKSTSAWGHARQQSQARRQACGHDAQHHLLLVHTHVHTRAQLKVPFDVLVLSCSDDNFIGKGRGAARFKPPGYERTDMRNTFFFFF